MKIFQLITAQDPIIVGPFRQLLEGVQRIGWLGPMELDGVDMERGEIRSHELQHGEPMFGTGFEWGALPWIGCWNELQSVKAYGRYRAVFQNNTCVVIGFKAIH